MISLYPFLYSSHAHTNERNKVKTRVDNFIQITVFCHPSLNKVDTFVYWNAAKAYSYTCYLMIYLLVIQRAKKVVSDSSGLVDFAIGLVNSVFNLPDGQVIFFEEFK